MPRAQRKLIETIAKIYVWAIGRAFSTAHSATANSYTGRQKAYTAPAQTAHAINIYFLLARGRS
jgi:hypothetical protein